MTGLGAMNNAIAQRDMAQQFLVAQEIFACAKKGSRLAALQSLSC
jgi:hypothetical protein